MHIFSYYIFILYLDIENQRSIDVQYLSTYSQKKNLQRSKLTSIADQ